MKTARKLSLISLHDYPREVYSAYWEIFINDGEWLVNLYSYEHKLISEAKGKEKNEEQARRASQTWVLERIESFRRPEPLVKMTEDHEKELRNNLEKAEREKKYGTVDVIRGVLKAYNK